MTSIPDGWMGLDNGPESTKLIQKVISHTHTHTTSIQFSCPETRRTATIVCCSRAERTDCGRRSEARLFCARSCARARGSC